MELTPPAAAGVQRALADPPNSAISETLKTLARTVRSFQLYLPNNPMHVRAIDAARSAFVALWDQVDRIELGITETTFTCDDVTVFAETERGGESLPWLFYKDGIRSIEIRKGFEAREITRFLGALQTVRTQSGADEDLVTLFWECDFDYLSYTYEEAGGDGFAAPGAELLRGGAPAGVVDAPADNEKDSGTYGSAGASEFARISDFDSTLYFLEQEEIAYLHESVRDDFSRDLRLSVAAALLDTFECESDPTVREEICGILESFMLVLLSGLQFRSAAFLLREVATTVARTDGILQSHRQRLGDLVKQISDPATLGQLLDVLEDTLLKPPQQDLLSLFAQLHATALRPLVAHLVRSRNGELRALLEDSVTRLAASNTGELIGLIGCDDEAVSLEAVRRSGDLKSSVAVSALAQVLEGASDTLRAAAVVALGQIASPGAMQVLERGLDDSDRAVRLAVVKAFTEREYRGILPRLERAIKERLLRDGSSAEKTAFFDAYATLGGDASVPLLEGILLPRGMLARKEDPATRASAAMALGRLGTERALDAVRRASGDKEIIVRSAAARALRGGL